MRKILSIAVLLLFEGGAYASELADAINNVRQNCSGISDELSDMKTRAGINTAVTAAGSVSGGVALGVGIAKAQTDRIIDMWEKRLEEMIEKQRQEGDSFATISDDDLQAAIQQWKASNPNLQAEIDELQETSKKLGNIRTGTLAANTATNIVGAAIAGTNQIKGDLQDQIDACIASVQNLTQAVGQARVSGEESSADIERASKIALECGMWDTVDLSSVNNRARGAAAASGVGAGMGMVGMITSAMANSNSVRDGDDKKEKALNTTANVMSGGATAASVTATVFNATQIRAIKRAADVADKCEGALK